MVYFIHIYKKKGERKKIKMIQSLLEHLHKLFVLDVCLLGVAFKALIYSFSSRLILQQYFSVWWWVKKDVCDFHIRIRCVRKTDFVTAGYVLTQLNIRGYCRRREVVVYFLSVSFYVHFFLSEYGLAEVSWSADVLNFRHPQQVWSWIIQERSSACAQSIDVLWITTKVKFLVLSIFPLQSG